MIKIQQVQQQPCLGKINRIFYMKRFEQQHQVEKMRIEEIAKEANIRGKVKFKYSVLFDSNDKKYAIIVNKIAINKIIGTSHLYYAIRLVNYECDHDFSDYESREVNKVKIRAVKRFPDLIAFYKKDEVVGAVERIQNTPELIKEYKYEFETQEDDRENIFLLGRTGSGKSTLANVLASEEIFKKEI